jgi:hypothetical protein
MFSYPIRLLKRFRRPAAIVGVIILLLGLWIAPWLTVPRLTAAPLAPLPGYHDYAGVLHVHSKYSHDSTGTVTEILQAARRQNLRFVLLADHKNFGAAGDGWEGWHEGVLLLVGAELSLHGRGHMLVFGIPKADTEKILALRRGDVQVFVDTVRRNGGLSIVLYPYLPSRQQRWQHWEVTGFTGIEVLNTFSNTVNEPKLTLLRAFLASRVNFPATLSALTKRPAEALSQWDRLSARNPVIATGGTDSHGRYFDYDQELPTTITHLVTRQVFKDDAQQDPQLIYNCLRRQSFYFSNDSLYPAGGFRFMAQQQGRTAGLGERLTLVPGEPAHLTGAVPYKGAINWDLYRDGRLVWQGKGPSMDYRAAKPGRYRVEVSYGSPARPWIFSSPIYLVSSSDAKAHAAGRKIE